MPSHSEIVQDNKKERQRLELFVRGLNESDFNVVLSNGWTVGSALVHLAFWDLRQETLIQRWVQKGVQPAALDWEALNGPLEKVGRSIVPKAAAKLVLDAGSTVDRAVEGLTPAQFEELIRLGFERNLHRAVHRRTHLAQIEKALSEAH